MSEVTVVLTAEGARDSVTVTDNRTGRSYEIPIEGGAIRASALRRIKVDDDDFGLLSYDPAFTATASCRSAITFIDGDRGILRYRGYPIDQLAEKSSFLEVAYLLINGELPGAGQLAHFTETITRHTFVHENVKKFIDGFRHDAHSMGICEHGGRAVDVLPSGEGLHEPGQPAAADGPADFQNADSGGVRVTAFSWTAIRLPGQRPVIRRQLPEHDVEDVRARSMNPIRCWSMRWMCCSSCTRITSRTAPPARCGRSAAPGSIPTCGRRGGSCALRALARRGQRAGTADVATRSSLVAKVPKYVERVKNGDFRLMGFGHRVYKNYDPRAKPSSRTGRRGVRGDRHEPAARYRGGAGTDRAWRTTYFVERKLYPNVDFYSGHHLPGDGLPGRDVPGAVRDRPRTPGGWPSGRSCCSTRNRRSRAHASLHRRGRTRLYQSQRARQRRTRPVGTAD